MDLQEPFREKYKDVPLKEASKFYYGEGNAMSRVLQKMQEGIDQAGAVYDGIKDRYDDPHVAIFIDQDNYQITFSIAEYDDEVYGPSDDSELFFSYEVGEVMAEALVLMQMMQDSNHSTGINQATNNWAEDLDFEHFGEFTMNVDISDSWGYIDY